MREFNAQADAAGLRIVVYTAKEARVTDEPWEKPARFIAPPDADEIYRVLHHGAALVVAFTTVFVRRDPSCNPVTLRQARRLEDFVAHKAQYALLNGYTDIGPALGDFEAWTARTSCTGRDDPRVLPLHTFATTENWADLDDDDARRRFDGTHGNGALRVDDDGRRWARATALHGWEALTIAGCELQAGLHWDVQFSRSSGELYCANEIWHVPRRGYVNVYPDGGVRGESGGPSAKRVWPPRR